MRRLIWVIASRSMENQPPRLSLDGRHRFCLKCGCEGSYEFSLCIMSNIVGNVMLWLKLLSKTCFMTFFSFYILLRFRRIYEAVYVPVSAIKYFIENIFLVWRGLTRGLIIGAICQPRWLTSASLEHKCSKSLDHWLSGCDVDYHT